MILSKLKLNKTNGRNRVAGQIIVTQRINIQCDKCGKIYETLYLNSEKCRKIYNSDFCQSCKLKVQYAQGLRENARQSTVKRNKTMFENKTFDEYYGKERAAELRAKSSIRFSGKNNPMYGRNDQCFKEGGCVQTTRKNIGKTYEEIHGKEKGQQLRQNLSQKFSGKNNPMYNKLSPQGSGNGWSGWYKGWYFRSLRELSYMINVIEANNQQWVSCENAKYSIPYEFMGACRTYFADFIVDNKYMIEIKPQKLLNTPNVLAKKEAAIKWCHINNLIYILISDKEFSVLSQEEIQNLVELGIVKFIERYEKLYEARYRTIQK